MALFKRGNSRNSGSSSSGDEGDKEKIAMSAKILELESANTDLRDRLRKLEMEYLERQDHINTGEVGLKSREKELENGLNEVYALKMTVDDYRGKVAVLSKEKVELETKVGELTSSLKEGNKRFEDESSAEVKKLEDEIEDVKRKAKEMVRAFQQETEGRIKRLEEENKGHRDLIKKMREQYGAWEAIDGL